MADYEGLLPSTPAVGSVRADRELPIGARKHKRLLDVTSLKPGDLLLFRSTSPQPDKTTAAIVSSQIEAGVPPDDARWTHAAMFLGDGELICEANIKVPGFRHGVMLRSVHAYVDEFTVIRARRPRGLSDQQRIRLAIGAMRYLGRGYSLSEAWAFWRAARRGEGMWNGKRRGPRIDTKALVCSTLYQDALAFVSHGESVAIGRMCAPAHLSMDQTLFEENEPKLNWLSLDTAPRQVPSGQTAIQIAVPA